MASSIDPLLYPSALTDLHEGLSPVPMRIWKGGDEYDDITLEGVYPFDTLLTLKQLLYVRMRNNDFIPKYVFIGYPTDESNEWFTPLDFVWNANGAKHFSLRHPLYTQSHPDTRFVGADGSYTSPNQDSIARDTVEDTLLKSSKLQGQEDTFPTLYVFPLSVLLRSYGQPPFAEEVWNGCIAPYFPTISITGPYHPTEDDIAFGKKTKRYLQLRENSLERLNLMVEEQVDVPPMEVKGIRQLMLTWPTILPGWEGAAALFYRLPATAQRPFLRLIPEEGTPITKLHVRGIIPFPTLEDPRVLDGWAKEASPEPGKDTAIIKYLHRPSVGVTQPIYGTIHLFQDGTMNLIIQPPQQIKKMIPSDFRYFRTTIVSVMEGLPQPLASAELNQASVIVGLRPSMRAKFSSRRLQQRLPYFYPFFTTITPLPNESPIISLRYKAVSKYATENKTFAFITQWTIQERDMSALSSALEQSFNLVLKRHRERSQNGMQKREKRP